MKPSFLNFQIKDFITIPVATNLWHMYASSLSFFATACYGLTLEYSPKAHALMGWSPVHGAIGRLRDV
jgi:hypothetical protein